MTRVGLETKSRPDSTPGAELIFGDDGDATLVLRGCWRINQPLTLSANFTSMLDGGPTITRLAFDTRRLEDWDSGLVAFVVSLLEQCNKRAILVDDSGLPEGVRALLRLAKTVPPPDGGSGYDLHRSYLYRCGMDIVALASSAGEILAFLGEVALGVRNFLVGGAHFRSADFWVIVEESGADALPIISLVSLLVGLIFGYIGDQQLAQFGAGIFVADLVGLAAVIQIGALNTAIVLAGRTGAAFAARIGTMQVNEEIDALRTLGISPIEFLVLPRMVALVLMMPLLAIYANMMTIIGGALVGSTIGGLTVTEYFVETKAAIGWNHIAQGLISATVYGAIVAISGCLRGMQCGRSASAVGEATTSAVVTALVFIVIAAAVLTVIFDAVGL